MQDWRVVDVLNYPDRCARCSARVRVGEQQALRPDPQFEYGSERICMACLAKIEGPSSSTSSRVQEIVGSADT